MTTIDKNIEEVEKHPLLISKGNRPRTGKVISCPSCGKEKYRTPNTIRAGRVSYCSRECAHKGLYKQLTKNCTVCDKEYTVTRSQEVHRGKSKYCSKKCKGVAQRKKYSKVRSEKTKLPKKLSSFKKWTWKVFSDYVRERDDWTCFTCGKQATGASMHAGHFVSRVRSATMFDERNVHAQCYSCNIHKKGNGAEYATRIIDKYGKDVFDEIINKSRQTHKFTYAELEDIYTSSRDRLKELKNRKDIGESD